jgi:hypothetical protein
VFANDRLLNEYVDFSIDNVSIEVDCSVATTNQKVSNDMVLPSFCCLENLSTFVVEQ